MASDTSSTVADMKSAIIKNLFWCKEATSKLTISECEYILDHPNTYLRTQRYCNGCGELKDIKDMYYLNGSPQRKCKSCHKVGRRTNAEFNEKELNSYSDLVIGEVNKNAEEKMKFKKFAREILKNYSPKGNLSYNDMLSGYVDFVAQKIKEEINSSFSLRIEVPLEFEDFNIMAVTQNMIFLYFKKMADKMKVIKEENSKVVLIENIKIPRTSIPELTDYIVERLNEMSNPQEVSTISQEEEESIRAADIMIRKEERKQALLKARKDKRERQVKALREKAKSLYKGSQESIDNIRTTLKDYKIPDDMIKEVTDYYDSWLSLISPPVKTDLSIMERLKEDTPEDKREELRLLDFQETEREEKPKEKKTKNKKIKAIEKDIEVIDKNIKKHNNTKSDPCQETRTRYERQDNIEYVDDLDD